MAKNPPPARQPKDGAASAAEIEALGGPIVPLPAAISTTARPRPIQLPTAGAASPPPETGMSQPGVPGMQIRRVTGSPPPPRIAGMTQGQESGFEIAPPVPVPAFLGGLTEEQSTAAKTCSLLRAACATALATLRNDVRTIGNLIAAVDASPAGADMAQRDGMDLAKVKELHGQLKAAVEQ